MDSGSSGSHRPPRLRRKSSAFKLTLSRASHSSILSTPLPPTPSLSSDFDSTTDYTLVIPSASLSTSPDSPITMSSTTPSLSSTTGIPTGGGVASFPNVPSASLSSTLEGLRQLVAKRITAWTYLRNAGMGKVYWFNTVLLTTSDLRSSFPNEKMRSRSTRLAILGMSLSSLLDIQPAHDFLRGLQHLSSEFDQIPEDKFSLLSTLATSSGVGTSLGTGGGGRGTQKGLFRGKKRPGEKDKPGQGGQGGGGGGGGAEFASGEGGESGYLFIPNIPFDLDYFQVLTTTCELLIETYTKIYSYLGSSSSLSNPSLSSSSTSFFPPSSSESLKSTSSNSNSGGLSQNLAEIVVKIDSRLKKLIAVLSKEIDTVARQAIRNELDVLGGGVEGWGFEGLSLGGSGGGVTAGGD